MNKFIVDLVNFLKKMLDLRLGLRLDLRLEVKKMLDSSGPDSNKAKFWIHAKSTKPEQGKANQGEWTSL